MITKYFYSNYTDTKEDLYNKLGGRTIIVTGGTPSVTSSPSWLYTQSTPNNLIVWADKNKNLERTGTVKFIVGDFEYSYTVMQLGDTGNASLIVNKPQDSVPYDTYIYEGTLTTNNIVKIKAFIPTPEGSNLPSIDLNGNNFKVTLGTSNNLNGNKLFHIVFIGHDKFGNDYVDELLLTWESYIEKFNYYYGVTNDSLPTSVINLPVSTSTAPISITLNAENHKRAYVIFDSTILRLDLWSSSLGENLVNDFKESGSWRVVNLGNNFKMYCIDYTSVIAGSYNIKLVKI